MTRIGDNGKLIGFDIDGAITMLKLHNVNEETGRTVFTIDDMDKTYNIGFVRVNDGTFWASRGGKELHKAVMFLINGKEVPVFKAEGKED